MSARLKVFTVWLATLAAAAFLAQQAMGSGPMMGPSMHVAPHVAPPSISHAPSLRSSIAPSIAPSTRLQPRANILSTSPVVPAQPNPLAGVPTTLGVQPNTVQPNTPASNVAPLPNQAPAVTTPSANSGLNIASMTPAEKAAEIAKLQGDNNTLVDGTPTGFPPMPAYPNTDTMDGGQNVTISGQTETAVSQAVEAGDPAKVQSLLTPQQLATTTGQEMLSSAQTMQVMQPLLAKANSGTMTTTDVANANAALSKIDSNIAATPAILAQMQASNKQTIDQLYNNSQAIAALKAGGPAQGALAGQPAGANGNNAQPAAAGGMNPQPAAAGGQNLQPAVAGGQNPVVPPGNNVPIALVPGMDQGAIVPLAGMVLVGVGDDPGGVTLGEGNVALAAGFPVGTAPPAPDAATDSACTGVVLINGASSAVNYSVNGTSYSMAPTFKQPLDGDQTWTVAFDRGGGAGTARYSLTAGTYKFEKSEKGWELFKQSYKVTLDNRDFNVDFHYVRNNKRETLPAGQTQELTGTCRPVVRFDDSAGKIKQKRLESGVYKVALAYDSTVDLFPAAGVISPLAAPPSEPLPPPPAVGSGEKVIHTANLLLPAVGSGKKPVGAARPLPPLFRISDPLASIPAQQFKISDPLASIRTQEKSLASGDNQGDRSDSVSGLSLEHRTDSKSAETIAPQVVDKQTRQGVTNRSRPLGARRTR